MKVRNFFIAVVCSIPTAVFAQAQPVLITPLRAFTNPPDAIWPARALVAGADGALYGTATTGGASMGGAIFKINRDGSGYSVLHSFSTGDNKPAAAGPPQFPGPSLIQGRDGALYGITPNGTNYPSGMVFTIKTDGSGYAVLHGFSSGDGGPLDLIQGADGALYGAGVNAVFKLDTTGSNYTVLHTFNSGTDGSSCYGLFQASDGSLYGTANLGGSAGRGTVFKLGTDGSGFTVLHEFSGGSDGYEPYSRLIQGSDGALYGTTFYGGTNRFGTVFKLNLDGGNYQVLCSLAITNSSGMPEQPCSGLVQSFDNLLYGTTAASTTSPGGAIYEIRMDGTGCQTVATFNGDTFAGLTRGPASGGSGVLYGVSYGTGGINDTYGTVFALLINPPVSITPSVGQSGNQPVVFWPAWAVNYQLQTATNPAGPWVTTSNYIPVAGAQLTNGQPAGFYRLVFPQ